MNDVLIDQS